MLARGGRPARLEDTDHTAGARFAMASPLTTLAAPLPSDAGQPLDLVFIEGLRLDTVIGIHDTELHHTQPITVDLVAGTPRSRACDTDRIADTIDYSVVRTRLVRLAADHGVQLLEAFAEQVANVLLGEFGAHWVRVAVAKPRKFDDVQSVGVVIERRRAASPAAPVLHLIGAGMVPGGRADP
jgi:7,8-dihydroneopterin aldolase/epimerase/oxygenase